MFTAGSKILLTGPGAITGGNGTALYTLFPGGMGFTMASVYGPSDNAIAFLDTNGLIGNTTEHQALYHSIASWMYTTASAYETSQQNNNPAPGVPDGGVSFVLTAGLVALCACRARKA